ncbi:MAG: hypothetical protein ACJAVV_003564 [Alphaproteobacteria bacterium]|jgi:hypothetical protein
MSEVFLAVYNEGFSNQAKVKQKNRDKHVFIPVSLLTA